MSKEERVIKVLVVGDSGVGKTSLARTICDGGFPTVDSLLETDAPGTTYKCTKETAITVGDCSYNLHTIDHITEQNIVDSLKQVDFCYVCYDMSCSQTLNTVKEKWIPIVKTSRRKVKVALVGLKQDLAHVNGINNSVTSQSFHESGSGTRQILANQIGACIHVEVSALKYLGIQELKEKTVFEYVGDPHSADGQTGKRRCVLM